MNIYLLSSVENAKLDRHVDSTPPLARSIYVLRRTSLRLRKPTLDFMIFPKTKKPKKKNIPDPDPTTTTQLDKHGVRRLTNTNTNIY